MSESAHCPTCGTNLATAAADGLCARCLFEHALRFVADPEVEDGHPWPYRTLNILGEGKTGTTYLAEQEHPVRRLVTMKVLRQSGLDTTPASLTDALMRCRQAIAAIDHPAVARVLDAGVTTEGRAYLVREYVQGLPVDTFCRRAQLKLPERLELIKLVCQAIEHVHRHGMTHGNVTATNVLVMKHSGVATPVLLDISPVQLLAGQEFERDAAVVEDLNALLQLARTVLADEPSLADRLNMLSTRQFRSASVLAEAISALRT